MTEIVEDIIGTRVVKVNNDFIKFTPTYKLGDKISGAVVHQLVKYTLPNLISRVDSLQNDILQLNIQDTLVSECSPISTLAYVDPVTLGKFCQDTRMVDDFACNERDDSVYVKHFYESMEQAYRPGGGGGGYSPITIPDDELEPPTVDGDPLLDHSGNEIDHIEMHPNNRVLFVFTDGRTEEHFWKDHSRRDSWNTEKRKKAAEKNKRK